MATTISISFHPGITLGGLPFLRNYLNETQSVLVQSICSRKSACSWSVIFPIVIILDGPSLLHGQLTKARSLSFRMFARVGGSGHACGFPQCHPFGGLLFLGNNFIKDMIWSKVAVQVDGPGYAMQPSWLSTTFAGWCSWHLLVGVAFQNSACYLKILDIPSLWSHLNVVVSPQRRLCLFSVCHFPYFIVYTLVAMFVWCALGYLVIFGAISRQASTFLAKVWHFS